MRLRKSGNRKRLVDHHGRVSCIPLGAQKDKRCRQVSRRRFADSQLQQGQVRIAVIGPVLALLRYVVLEYGGGFGVVAIEAVEDGIDVLRPFGRIIEGNAHCRRESVL